MCVFYVCFLCFGDSKVKHKLVASVVCASEKQKEEKIDKEKKGGED